MNAMKNAVRNASDATKKGLAKLVKPKNRTLSKKNAKAQRKARKATLTRPADYVEHKPADVTPTGFELGAYAKGLLNRAVRNVMENKGEKIEDDVARTEIENRSAILEACNGDLALAMTCISEVGDDPVQTASTIYSLNYQILKSVGFFANLDLRRYLDPHQDNDMPSYADRREEHREAPIGLHGSEQADSGKVSPDSNRKFTPGYTEEEFSDATILQAMRDISIILTTSTEAFGWEDRSGAGIPFAVEMNKDGTFTSYYDALQALDFVERQRQVRRAKQRDQRSHQMAAAAKLARKQAALILANAQA